MNAVPSDLLILVADADIEETMKGLLANPGRLGIRPIRWDIRRHVRSGPGLRASFRGIPAAVPQSIHACARSVRS
jgi:hypothetical protein